MAKNIFNTVSVPTPQYSWFDLSHDHKLTFEMGNLVPVLTTEVLPGDKWEFSTEGLIRFMPMIAPIMHKVDITVHHFFVPNRILWKNWERFISPPGTNSLVIPPAAPTLDHETVIVTENSLADYMGLPIGNYAATLGEDIAVSALPFAAYQMIYFEYYRAQSLITPDMLFSDWIDLQNGEQDNLTTTKLMELKKRAWEHDYFTACLPYAQKGDPVLLPVEVTLSANLPVNYIPDIAFQQAVNLDGTPLGVSSSVEVDGTLETAAGVDFNIDPNGSLAAQGPISESATSTTINDFRAALALQRYLELNARAGTRYTETIYGNFGVYSSDKRLQRPEYLGGSKSRMAISEVLNMVGTESEVSTFSPLGTMGGHGVSAMPGNYTQYFAEEHGIIMSLLSVIPKTVYHQGIPKLFSKFDRFDYAWPLFSQIGEEPVKNKELYLDLNPVNDNDGTFGYLPRYSEYRYLPSRVSGNFHSSLAYWSLHRTFDSLPTLSEEFINCLPSKRIFAVEDDAFPALIGHVYHSINVRRALPKYGTPTI